MPISKVRTEGRGNLGDFCKMDACQRKGSTQECSKTIPEFICTLRIKQNNCLKYSSTGAKADGGIFCELKINRYLAGTTSVHVPGTDKSN